MPVETRGHHVKGPEQNNQCSGTLACTRHIPPPVLADTWLEAPMQRAAPQNTALGDASINGFVYSLGESCLMILLQTWRSCWKHMAWFMSYGCPADLEDEDKAGMKSAKRKKSARRRRYEPRKARDFKAMDNFEVPFHSRPGCAALLHYQMQPI